MKNIAFFLLLILSVVSGQVASQAYQDEITTEVNQFIELSNLGDWDQAFDKMYPKLFESVTKEELVVMMQQMEESGVQIKTNEHEIKSFSNIETVGEEDFVFVKYKAIQTLKMGAEIMDDESQRGAMLFNLKSMFGSDSVSFEESEKAFVINAEKSMYAISNKGVGKWYLVENNQEQVDLLNLLIPTEIQEKFKG